MNSRVSWSVDGIDPSVRDRAEAAARRAGMSLNDWLNSTLGASTPPDFRAPYDQQRQSMPSEASRDVADIHQRLDAITRQIDQISKPAPRNDAPRSEAPRGQPTVARQLNDAISRLDARLSQISNPAPARQTQAQDEQRQTEAVERAAAQVYRASPPLSPASLDSAIAEITARQNELDGPPPRSAPPRRSHAPPPSYAPPPPPAAPVAPSGPDFSSLERHLIKITSQIEALQRPDHIEQSIAAFRSELAEIRQAITEAMPRRAIESLENEIRSLHHRIDDNRQNGTDSQALAGIERALSEIREALRSLTPAEQLAGYDDAIRNLGAKLDLILRANDDPSTVHQLEGAIAALRSIVSNVASNDALARLSEDVHTLSTKVDQLARTDSHGDSFAILEQRISALTSTLESRERPAASDNSEQLENAMRALSERIDRMQVGNDSASAFAHLEQRVSYLLERIETSSGSGSGDLGHVEEGLQDILRHLERQHANLVALAESNRQISAPAPMAIDSGLIDMVKRELSDIRFSQSETDRRTQDSLETVHNTLGHVVDRLSMIEGDLRAVRSAPIAPAQPVSMPVEPRAEAPRVATPPAMAPQPKPELPNPAAREDLREHLQEPPQAHFAAAPREFHAAQPPAAPAPPQPPRAISEILEPPAAPPRASDRTGSAAGSSARAGHATDRRGWLRPPSASPPRRARSAKFRRRAEKARQHLELHRRRPPRRPGRRCAAGQREGRPRGKQGCGKGQGRRQAEGRPGALDHHLQDPLAAGRRQRGRDRARHLQDGDDAARHRQRAADAGDGEIGRAGPARPRRCKRTRTTRGAGARSALDDLADPDRPAIATTLPRRNTPDSAASRDPAGPAIPAAPPVASERCHRRRFRPRRPRLPAGKLAHGAGAAERTTA